MPPTTASNARTNDRTARLAQIDADHVWHPFTPMRQWREKPPVIIERAEGFTLFDTEGNAYIDGFSSLWCNVLGHRVPEIDQAIRDQLDRVAHTTLLGYASVPSIQLARRLVSIAPGDLRHGRTKVFYSDAGATAVELALKMAVGYHYHRGDTQRTIFVGLEGAYHGDTTGSFSVGYSDVMHRPFAPMTFRTVRAASPDVCRVRAIGAGNGWPSRDAKRCEQARDAALADLDRVLDEVGDRCAGVVIEPLVQGAAGMITQPGGYLRAVAQRVRERGLLLIADEVATGFARTGEMFACDVEGVTPDILCLAKGISGGYLPLAATLCREEIAAAFEGEYHEHRTLYHGHTYTGNPLACAAALATIDLIERDAVVENARRIGELIRARLRQRLRDHPSVGDVRGRGVMTGIELVASRSPWRRFDPAKRVGQAVCDAARNHAVIVRPLGNVVILNPAPAMDEPTAERLVEAVIAAIETFDFDSPAR